MLARVQHTIGDWVSASAVSAFASAVEVESMGLVEATRLLLRRAQREAVASEEEIDEAANLAVALAQFRLALDQAGAYIEETGAACTTIYTSITSTSTPCWRGGGRRRPSIPTRWRPPGRSPLPTSNGPTRRPLSCCSCVPFWPPTRSLRNCSPRALRTGRPLCSRRRDRLPFNQLLEVLLAFSLVKRLSERPGAAHPSAGAGGAARAPSS